MGVAIRGKRNELRAGKEAVKREATPQSLGGHARSLSMTPEERSDIASRAAKARWEKRRSAS